MDAKVIWQEGMRFLASADSGHELILDSSEKFGGQNAGFRPTELLALGAAGCSSMDVTTFLRKKRVDFSAFECAVKVTSRQDEHPHVFTEMEFTYTVSGRDLKLADVEWAVNLSEEKYCQCIAMLGKTAKISHKIVLLPA